MTTRPRRLPTPSAARVRLASIPVVVLLAVAACGTAEPTGPTVPPTGSLGSPVASSPSPGPSGSSAPSGSPGPSLTPVPGGPTPLPTPAPGTPVPTTVTDWGTILDALPFDFPVYPGSHEAQPLEGPASGAFSVPASGPETATWYQAALEGYGLSTIGMSGPLEDGQVVIDSEGAKPGCRVQTTIRPLSGTTHVSVLIDAACAG